MSFDIKKTEQSTSPLKKISLCLENFGSKRIQCFQKNFIQNLELSQILTRKSALKEKFLQTRSAQVSQTEEIFEDYNLSDFFIDTPDNLSCVSSQQRQNKITKQEERSFSSYLHQTSNDQQKGKDSNEKCIQYENHDNNNRKSLFYPQSEKHQISSFSPSNDSVETKFTQNTLQIPKFQKSNISIHSAKIVENEEENKNDLNENLISRKKYSYSNLSSTQLSKVLNLEKINVSSAKNLVQQENKILFGCSENQFSSKYYILEKLGDGMQGQVTKCQNIATNKIYAAKTFNISQDEEIRSQILSEFNIMQNLDHPGILKVYEILDKKTDPTIIMEYFEGLNLKDIQLNLLKTEEKCKIILQLLNIVSYIHQQNIIHRDIQLRNVLYNKSTQEIKLIDFGIAKKQIKNQLSLSQCGLRHYQAPEMLNGHQYTQKVDIWQIGQIFYEMVENCQMSSRKIINLIKKNQLPFKNSSEKIQEFILQLLQIKSNKRIDAETAKDILCQILI